MACSQGHLWAGGDHLVWETPGDTYVVGGRWF